MPAVILFSHGSTLCGAGRQLECHAERLRAGGEYSSVQVGYLNYSTPTFLQAVQACAERDERKIIIAPYFLAPGYFVKAGLPRVLAPARAAYPHLRFAVAPPLGEHPLLVAAVRACSRRASAAGQWRTLVERAPLFCERDAACPLFGRCALRSSELPADTEYSVVPPAAALLLMVHGSPDEKSNDEMFCVAQRVREQLEYSAVATGFMECNSPTIPQAIAELVAAGAHAVVAVPYFLHAGTHVADDLPSLLEAARQKYAAVEIFMGDYLGRDPLVSELLRVRIAEARFSD